MGAANVNYNLHLLRVSLGTVDTRLANLEEASKRQNTLGGNSASVTSGAAVLLIAASGSSYWRRDIDIRPVGGDIYVADDSGVGASNGHYIKDGEVCTLQDYVGAVYAIATGATVTVHYGIAQRT